MPDVLASRCKLCWGDGKCWYCRGAGEIHLLGKPNKPCGECAPGSPGRCIRCSGSGTQPDEAA